MTILITGGAGYIGSHMALRLADENKKAVVVDDLSTGRRRLVPDDMVFIEGDCGDRTLLDRIFTSHGVEAVMHFAGSIVLPESIARPLEYYENNTSKSRTLIEACIRHGIRNFIFSSTAAVYNQGADIPLGENAPLHPLSPYGTSKLMTEWILRDAAAAHDLNYVILRYFNIAGADPEGRSGQPSKEATHLIKVACQSALGQRPEFTIFGSDYPTADGTCIRDYIHVSDLIDAHSLALDYLRGGGESRVYNCGYGKGASVLDVLATLQKVTGQPLPFKYGPRRPGDVPELIADSTRIHQELGWTPRYDDLEFIIRTALDWERSLGAKSQTISSAGN